MKKQINPTIKAHLIRSAFYLLLLLAVCAIPFALAQRNAAKQSMTKPATPSNSLTSLLKLKPASKPVTAEQKTAVQKKGVPLSAGAAPRQLSGPVSEFPEVTSSRATGAQLLRILPQPKAPQVVLYDQYNNASTTATNSQEFPDFATFSDFTADDFVVPGGQTWTVQSIDADGIPFNCTGSCVPDNFNVFFYTNSAGLPGTQVYSATAQTFVIAGSTYTITLTTPAVLAAGTYWVSVQAHEMFTGGGEWGWTDRTVQSNSPAAWQNPGGGFAVCPTWMPKQAVCVPTSLGPDQVYRLNGTIGGGGTPTPTPTGTPATCSTYNTTTGTGTITPGTTDTGNHCDDCPTAVALPFPVSVYGQTFNTANVGSNGSLDLIGTQAPFTHACQVLPNTLWTMAILPYQDDLRTDNLSFTGCNVFPGATCGVFTSVTGTAPNRQL